MTTSLKSLSFAVFYAEMANFKAGFHRYYEHQHVVEHVVFSRLHRLRVHGAKEVNSAGPKWAMSTDINEEGRS